MSNEWVSYALSEVIEIIGGGTPKRSEPSYWNGDIPWLSVADFNHGLRFVDSATEKITELGLKKSSTKLLEPSDIIISARGTVGCLAQLSKPMAFNQSCYGLRAKSEFLINDYLYYLLCVKVSELKQYVHGAVFDTITRTTFDNLIVNLPPLEIQKSISSVLGAIDQKIQLNQQINQTLEEMAQALFKSWFVDFEPTKAKIAALAAGGNEEDANLAAMQAISGKTAAELEQLKTQNPENYQQLHTTAQHFPAAMQDSELGEIPEGWDCLSLDEVANYLNGLALQKFRPEDETADFLPVLKIAQLRKGATDGEEKASIDIKPEYIVDDGDVIFSWSGSLLVDIWCGSKAALNQHLFKVTSDKYPKWLYYYYTKHHLDEFQRIASYKAVTMGHIKRSHLEEAKCVIPSPEFLERISKTFEGFLSKAIEVRLENKNLSKIRDELLPRLLSGEINV